MTKKKHTKKDEEIYDFVNIAGNTVMIKGSETLEDLVRRGLKDIRLVPIGSPLPVSKDWYVHTPK